MPRRTKSEAEATRQAILQAATEVFVAKGVARASLQEIARSAGVTRGAIYWHFKNKIDVFKALHDQLYTSFSERVLADLELDHPQPLEQLEQLCRAISLEFVGDSEKNRILTIFFLRCDYSGDLEAVLARQKERKAKSVQMLSEYFKRAQAKGHLKPDANTQVLTLALVSFLTGMIYEQLRNPELFDLTKNASALIDQFFSGVGKDR